MIDIYDRQPVNKTAAVVTSQSGCASDDTLSGEQLRENLVAQLKALLVEILKHPRGSQKRKALNIMKRDIEIQINAIRPKRKAPSVDQYFIGEAREALLPFQFKRIMDRAVERMREAEA